MHVCQDWAAWNAVIAVISLGSCSRKSLIRMYICTFVDVDHDFDQIIRTWNALSWSCSRKPLIKTHIWRNYVIKGVGELFKGVVAKNIYHYRRCWFLTYLNLNWWPDHDFHQETMNGQRPWAIVESYIFKIPILKGQAPVSMKLLFMGENGFWTNAIAIPNILYCYVPKVDFVCFYIFFVCGCSYQRYPRLVWEVLNNSDSWNRFSSYLSLDSCEVHHIVLHSSSQDLFHPNRFKVLLLRDSQDLFHPDRFNVFFPNGLTRSCSMSIQSASNARQLH